MKILINFIGIVIFFLNLFNGRTDKTKEPSIKFWFKDNYPELIVIALFDFALMILLIFGGLKIDFTKLIPTLPEWMTFAGDLAACFLIGLLGANAGYSLIKRKVNDSKS